MTRSSTLNPSGTTSGSISGREARELVCDLCRHFYGLGWASGTGGGVSIRSGGKIFMAPSGVQKERLNPDDIFVLDEEGKILEPPSDPALRISACKPLFLHAYQLRNAGAVIHSHSLHAVMATLVSNDRFQITGIEMIKGVRGHGVFDLLEVPIIENTAHESELADSLQDAIVANPKSYAVLVRGHGVYVWGKDWVEAKTHAESYDYLFQTALGMINAGLDPSKERGNKR